MAQSMEDDDGRLPPSGPLVAAHTLSSETLVGVVDSQWPLTNPRGLHPGDIILRIGQREHPHVLRAPFPDGLRTVARTLRQRARNGEAVVLLQVLRGSSKLELFVAIVQAGLLKRRAGVAAMDCSSAHLRAGASLISTATAAPLVSRAPPSMEHDAADVREGCEGEGELEEEEAEAAGAAAAVVQDELLLQGVVLGEGKHAKFAPLAARTEQNILRIERMKAYGMAQDLCTGPGPPTAMPPPPLVSSGAGTGAATATGYGVPGGGAAGPHRQGHGAAGSHRVVGGGGTLRPLLTQKSLPDMGSLEEDEDEGREDVDMGSSQARDGVYGVVGPGGALGPQGVGDGIDGRVEFSGGGLGTDSFSIASDQGVGDRLDDSLCSVGSAADLLNQHAMHQQQLLLQQNHHPAYQQHHGLHGSGGGGAGAGASGEDDEAYMYRLYTRPTSPRKSGVGGRDHSSSHHAGTGGGGGGGAAVGGSGGGSSTMTGNSSKPGASVGGAGSAAGAGGNGSGSGGSIMAFKVKRGSLPEAEPNAEGLGDGASGGSSNSPASLFSILVIPSESDPKGQPEQRRFYDISHTVERAMRWFAAVKASGAALELMSAQSEVLPLRLGGMDREKLAKVAMYGKWTVKTGDSVRGAHVSVLRAVRLWLVPCSEVELTLLMPSSSSSASTNPTSGTVSATAAAAGTGATHMPAAPTGVSQGAGAASAAGHPTLATGTAGVGLGGNMAGGASGAGSGLGGGAHVGTMGGAGAGAGAGAAAAVIGGVSAGGRDDVRLCYSSAADWGLQLGQTPQGIVHVASVAVGSAADKAGVRMLLRIAQAKQRLLTLSKIQAHVLIPAMLANGHIDCADVDSLHEQLALHAHVQSPLHLTFAL